MKLIKASSTTSSQAAGMFLGTSPFSKLPAGFSHRFLEHTQSTPAGISYQMGHYLKIRNMIIPDEGSSVNLSFAHIHPST